MQSFWPYSNATSAGTKPTWATAAGITVIVSPIHCAEIGGYTGPNAIFSLNMLTSPDFLPKIVFTGTHLAFSQPFHQTEWMFENTTSYAN